MTYGLIVPSQEYGFHARSSLPDLVIGFNQAKIERAHVVIPISKSDHGRSVVNVVQVQMGVRGV